MWRNLFVKRLWDAFTSGKRLIGGLIDPDSYSVLYERRSILNEWNKVVDFWLVGGSVLVACNHSVRGVVRLLKALEPPKPVVLFPGGPEQVIGGADYIFLLHVFDFFPSMWGWRSLVQSARLIEQHGLKPVPVAYILLAGQIPHAVHVSAGVKGIPARKTEMIVLMIRLAYMLGYPLIYIDGGSGCDSVPQRSVLRKVVDNSNLPVIYGGGIDGPEKLKEVFESGVTCAIIGNAIVEEAMDPDVVQHVLDG